MKTNKKYTKVGVWLSGPNVECGAVFIDRDDAEIWSEEHNYSPPRYVFINYEQFAWATGVSSVDYFKSFCRQSETIKE